MAARKAWVELIDYNGRKLPAIGRHNYLKQAQQQADNLNAHQMYGRSDWQVVERLRAGTLVYFVVPGE